MDIKDKKAQIFKALDKCIDPPPHDLINELTSAMNVDVMERKIKMWMGCTRAQWLLLRPNDGIFVYNALN